VATQKELAQLPPRFFLYTLDQVATIVNMTEATLKNTYVHFDGRSVGARPHSKLMARNIAQPGTKPEWRIAENEVVRWLRYNNFKVYTRHTLSS